MIEYSCSTRLAHSVIAGGAMLVFSLLSAMPAAAQAATELTLDDCQLVPDDAARLACYDRVIKAGRANVAPTPYPAPNYAPAPSSAGAGAGAGTGAPLTAEQRRAQQQREFGLPVYETQQAQEVLKEVTLEIVSTGVAAGGKLRFTANDGSVWIQTEGTPAVPQKPGTAVRITRNFVGGEVCKIGYTIFRCTRVDRGENTAPPVPGPDSSRTQIRAEAEPVSQPTVVPTAPQQVAATPVAAQPIVNEQGELSEITAEVASTSKTRNGKLRIVTVEGMIWDQTTGGVPSAPKPGSAVVISRNFMGGNWCKLDKWTSVRCRRVDTPETAQTASAAPVQVASVASTQMQSDTRTDAAPEVATELADTVPAASDVSAPQVSPDQRAEFGLHKPTGAGAELPDEFTVEVASASLSADGKVRLVTTDGMVWSQTVGRTSRPPEKGSAVTIKRGTLGSYFCQLDKYNSVRCQLVE